MRTLPIVQPLSLRSLEPGPGHRRVTWLELFFDLVFVASVAHVAAPLRDDYSPAGLLRFAGLFALATIALTTGPVSPGARALPMRWGFLLAGIALVAGTAGALVRPLLAALVLALCLAFQVMPGLLRGRRTAESGTAGLVPQSQS